MDPLAVAISFAALGANVLTTGLLLLFNPRSASVRWYALFLCAISLWLLARGVIAMGTASHAWITLLAASVQLLPPLFLAASFAQVGRPAAWSIAAAAIGALLLPITLPSLLGEPGAITIALHVAGWGGGIVVQTRHESKHERTGRRTMSRVLNWLLVLPPAIAAIGIAINAETFFTYVMPLIVIGVHFAIFGGIVWLRYYDIEVRVARSGEIAGRAAEAERLAAVGEMSASIAHEIRNPLAGIRSLAQRLAEDEVDSAHTKRYAGVIVEEAGRLDRIVGDLLALARRGTTGTRTTEPTALRPLFDDVALLTASRAERAGVRVVTRARGLSAPAPREALAQALLNLVLNAIRHSPVGGTVTLEAGTIDGAAKPPDRAEMRAVDETPRGVRISVRDHGPGVLPAERDRIFEPFHTAGSDGTGLGLSVVRRLARELAWQVDVQDAKGGGAEFVLTIGGEGACES